MLGCRLPWVRGRLVDVLIVARGGGNPSGIRHDLKPAGGEASDELLQTAFGRGQVIIETLNAARAFGIQGENAELQDHGFGVVWLTC